MKAPVVAVTVTVKPSRVNRDSYAGPARLLEVCRDGDLLVFVHGKEIYFHPDRITLPDGFDPSTFQRIS